MFNLRDFIEFISEVGEQSKIETYVEQYISIKTIIINIPGANDANAINALVYNLSKYGIRFSSTRIEIINTQPYKEMKLTFPYSFDDPYVKPVKIDVEFFVAFPNVTSISLHDIEIVSRGTSIASRGTSIASRGTSIASRGTSISAIPIENISLYTELETVGCINQYIKRVFIKYSGVIDLNLLKKMFPNLETVYVKSIKNDYHSNGVRVKKMVSFHQQQYQRNLCEWKLSSGYYSM
jgi:hypothetical protein